jgi:hypothetical protein
MEQVQKPSNSKCYTTSSEPFRIYMLVKGYGYGQATLNKLYNCYMTPTDKKCGKRVVSVHLISCKSKLHVLKFVKNALCNLIIGLIKFYGISSHRYNEAFLRSCLHFSRG